MAFNSPNPFENSLLEERWEKKVKDRLDELENRMELIEELVEEILALPNRKKQWPGLSIYKMVFTKWRGGITGGRVRTPEA